MTGTPFYMAPEVIKGNNYDSMADVWSLGVLLYIFLSGYMPFPARTREELFQKIERGKFTFDHKEFAKVSKEGKDLINHLLVLDPKKRFTASEILKHPWFEKNSEKNEVVAEDDALDSEVFKRLKTYKAESFLKRAAMNIFVKMTTEKEMHLMSEKFKSMDLDGTGMINISEIKTYISTHIGSISDEELKEMIDELDAYGNGKINYTEFLAATIDVKTFFTDAKLKSVFAMFDTDGSGKITEENMYNAF